MINSILNSIKKMLGIEEDYTHFDADILFAINSAFMILNQLGVGPKEGFSITNSATSWDAFTTRYDVAAIKSYVYLRTRLIFDPPSNSFTIDAIERQIKEFEWRLNVEVEGGTDYGVG